MTIDEAIKAKEEYRREHFYGFDPRFVEADDLSIEALKAVKSYRQGFSDRDFYHLPGETTD